MNKKSLHIAIFITLALLLAVAPILGCAKKTTPPAAKLDKVILHHFGDLSGPYAGITAPIVTGMRDYIDSFNAEYGGIDGVPIAEMFRDTGGKLDAALAAYAAFKESEPYPIFIMLYGSAEAEALKERFIEDKIFCFSNSPSVKALYPPGYEFSTIPGYSDSMGAFVDWVTGVWAKKTGQPVKMAILTWDNPYGKAIMVDETLNYAKSKGIEIVYEGTFGLREVDASTQMAAIKAAGANWVYDNTLAHGPKVVHGAAAAMGMLNKDLYDTTPGMIHRATGPWGMDESSAMLSGELADGLVGPRSMASWAMTDIDSVKKVIAVADQKNRDDRERVMGYLGMFPMIYTTSHCIGEAVKEVGWDQLDGSALRDQFAKLKDFDAMGMTFYTFSMDKPEPRKTRIFQVQSEKLLPISDWVTCPDLRPAEFK